MTSLEKLLGVPTYIDLHDKDDKLKSVKIYPVWLEDWDRFNVCVRILALETVFEIFSFNEGPGMLYEVLKITTKQEGLEELLGFITQRDYAQLRETVIAQNDIRFIKQEEKEAGEQEKKD